MFGIKLQCLLVIPDGFIKIALGESDLPSTHGGAGVVALAVLRHGLQQVLQQCAVVAEFFGFQQEVSCADKLPGCCFLVGSFHCAGMMYQTACQPQEQVSIFGIPGNQVFKQREGFQFLVLVEQLHCFVTLGFISIAGIGLCRGAG